MLKKIFGVIFLMAGIAGFGIGGYLFVSSVFNLGNFGGDFGLSRFITAIFICFCGSVVILVGISMIKHKEIQDSAKTISQNIQNSEVLEQRQKTAENIKNAIGKFEKIFGVSIQEKVCPYCGTKMEPKAKKCDSCGAKL